MSKSKIALGALLGAAVGVVAGVLTAPKSGKETRADIKAKAGEIGDDVRDKAIEVKNAALNKADDIASFAGEYKERGEEAVHGAVDGAKKGFFKKR